MNDAVKFTWNGGSKHEAGIAVYEIGTSTYTIRFPTPRPANLVHMALSDAYREGYERGLYSAKAEALDAASKLPEERLAMQNKLYEKLDSLIIKAISKSNRNPIYDRDVAVEALRIARETGRSDMRVVDGRLTVLRKLGVIRYFNNTDPRWQRGCGWYLVSMTEAQ